MQFQENIFKFGVEWREEGKNVRFSSKTGHITKTVRDRGKVTINH